MRRVEHTTNDDGLTIVEHVPAGDGGSWPLVFAAALVVIMALGGGL